MKAGGHSTALLRFHAFLVKGIDAGALGIVWDRMEPWKIKPWKVKLPAESCGVLCTVI